jgi:hypothetical protein
MSNVPCLPVGSNKPELSPRLLKAASTLLDAVSCVIGLQTAEDSGDALDTAETRFGEAERALFDAMRREGVAGFVAFDRLFVNTGAGVDRDIKGDPLNLLAVLDAAKVRGLG